MFYFQSGETFRKINIIIYLLKEISVFIGIETFCSAALTFENASFSI